MSDEAHRCPCARAPDGTRFRSPLCLIHSARATIDQALAVGLGLVEAPRRPRGRPPNPTPRRGGVRITPQDRANVRACLAHLAEDAGAGNVDAAAQLRSVRRLLMSWENRQRHSGGRRVLAR